MPAQRRFLAVVEEAGRRTHRTEGGEVHGDGSALFDGAITLIAVQVRSALFDEL
jgi:hypothetical protein